MRVAPFGEWESPITAPMVAGAGVRFDDAIAIDGDGTLYWVESRPAEGGRSVVVRAAPDGTVADVTPAGGNTRSRVHEYGGGAYTVADGVVFAVEFADQRLYRLEQGTEPVPITPEPELPAALRYADMAIGDGWLICVRERHRADAEPSNELVRVRLDGSAPPQVIASGNDFYASPRISPEGSRLAWLTWDHPDMPWNGTSLWVAALGGDGEITGEPKLLAGGRTESVYQPTWAPDGTLYFASDRSGWWNLYRTEGADVEPVHLVEGDVGVPQWVFGTSRFAVCEDGTVLAIVKRLEGMRLDLVAPDGTVRNLPAPGPWIGATVVAAGRNAYLIAGAPDRFPELVQVDISTGEVAVLHRHEPLSVDPACLSLPAQVSFDTPDGPAYAFHYPPSNPDFAAPEGEAPPLLVVGHGGPTGAARPVLDPAVQFWTTRGFAVLDVDYGGSVGYGRAYWTRLAGTWGIVDVRDCALAASAVAGRGQADPQRLAIRGGSAGGFTTLAALAFTDVFSAGASYFGVADLGLLAAHTHKFESRYLDWLVGPLPDSEPVYRERSPIYAIDRITCPVILLQGLEDRVVPPEQAAVMASALTGRGIPVAHVTFPGEGHGFRSADSQIRALESELSFYGRVFGFTPAGNIEPVRLE
jgi:dipeptidyl aminopeptidase/acylaminoacyl peptidase